MGNRHHHRIGRRSRHAEASFAKAAQADGLGERKRVPGSGFLLRGGDDPDIVRKGAGDRFQHLEAGCVHPIVVGEKNPHQLAISRWAPPRSEEHTSELQSLMRISYAVFCLKKTTTNTASTLTLYTSII